MHANFLYAYTCWIKELENLENKSKFSNAIVTNKLYQDYLSTNIALNISIEH